MKKKLAIVSYSDNTIDTYYKQILGLFAAHLDRVDVEKICIGNSELKAKIDADVILLPGYDCYDSIKEHIRSNSQVVFCDRTISKKGMKIIKRLPEKSEIFIIDETLEMAKGIAEVLYQKGLNNLRLVPCSVESGINLKDKSAMILGHTANIPNELRELIDIGSSLLDISTIIDMAFRLDLLEDISNQDIWKTLKNIEVDPANPGLAHILGKVNRFESELEMMLKLIDGGVVGINVDGKVFTYNDNARKIFGYKKEDILNKAGIDLFSEIPFKEVIQSRVPEKDRLVNVRGYDIIVSVEPVIHSGKLYGAVAISRKFSEVEMKQHKLRSQLIGKGYKAKYRLDDIIGESESIRKCKNAAKKMANSNSTVLIIGESGTGKELFAQGIHNASSRSEYQFVAVNCGSIPESLLESELFGYEEGAFSGARKGGKPGLFELAHKGTLFLDEIGEMPLNLQTKLLRVLQEREVMRIGGDRLIKVDVRLIAATNRVLSDMVEHGKFREDLFYRINVLMLNVPPLNSRKGDIKILVDKFRDEFGSKFELTYDAEKELIEHKWKGNVRELRNCIEHIVHLETKLVDVDDLPFKKVSNVKKANEDFEKDIVREFTSEIQKKASRYVFVLDELRIGFEKKERLGRRSILERLEGKDVFVSEQEIRTILHKLEKNGMVETFRGRSGTVITSTGLRLLEYLKKV